MMMMFFDYKCFTCVCLFTTTITTTIKEEEEEEEEFRKNSFHSSVECVSALVRV